MKKLKIVSVVGTRPEIIRLSRVLVQLDLHCEHAGDHHQALNLVDGAPRVLPLGRKNSFLHCSLYLGAAAV